MLTKTENDLEITTIPNLVEISPNKNFEILKCDNSSFLIFMKICKTGLLLLSILNLILNVQKRVPIK